MASSSQPSLMSVQFCSAAAHSYQSLLSHAILRLTCPSGKSKRRKCELILYCRCSLQTPIATRVQENTRCHGGCSSQVPAATASYGRRLRGRRATAAAAATAAGRGQSGGGEGCVAAAGAGEPGGARGAARPRGSAPREAAVPPLPQTIPSMLLRPHCLKLSSMVGRSC